MQRLGSSPLLRVPEAARRPLQQARPAPRPCDSSDSSGGGGLLICSGGEERGPAESETYRDGKTLPYTEGRRTQTDSPEREREGGRHRERERGEARNREREEMNENQARLGGKKKKTAKSQH